MDEIKQIVERIVEEKLNYLFKSDRYVFEKLVQLLDGRNIQTGLTTGTKIGTATTQKIAFHNSTPVIQRTGAAQASVATTAATSTNPWGYTTQAQADAIVTLVNELRATMVEKGLIKGSA